MSTALRSLLGADVPVAATGLRDNAVVIGTPANSPAIRGLGLESQLQQAGPEGFVIRTGRSSNHPVVVVASSGEIGALYGTFHFLRLLQTGAPIDRARRHRAAQSAAAAAQSLGQPRRHHRARLCRPLALAMERAARDDQPALRRLRARQRLDRHQRRRRQQRQRRRADPVARIPPQGRGARRRLPARTASAMYLSANFAAPITSRRPEDRRSARPGRRRLVEGARPTRSTRSIPDFGGFLVKANSEGQPGPKDYGRTSRRRRQRARRRPRAARRQRHLARVRLRRGRRSRSRQARLHRVHQARRPVPAERPPPGEERRRSTSCRASRSIRSSAR